ncbi:hypothetical protein [Desulfatiferula olefinivorans]
MKIYLIIVVTLFCLSSSSLAYGNSFECLATIDAVLLYANGNINVKHSGRGNYTVICNVNAERDGVSPTTCALWASMLLRLKSEGKPAHFYYKATEEYDSCEELPTYGSAPSPVYIGPINSN